MHADGQLLEVEIEGANHDACVVGPLAMQPDEVTAVQRDDRPAVASREREQFFVRHGAVGLAGIQDREDVVPRAAECDDSREWEVLVRIEARHELRRFVVLDLPIDFFTMRADVRPCVRKILCSQRRVGTQQVRVRRAFPARLLENPQRNSRSHDARGAAADPRGGLDPREGVTKIASDPLEHLRLFATAQASQQALDFLEIRHHA